MILSRANLLNLRICLLLPTAKNSEDRATEAPGTLATVRSNCSLVAKGVGVFEIGARVISPAPFTSPPTPRFWNVQHVKPHRFRKNLPVALERQ